MSLQSYALFLRAFAANPKSVGALFPSAPALAYGMTKHLTFFPHDHVVELGPGTGSFTRYILAKLASPKQYLGVELNPKFTQELKQQFPYAEFACGQAEQLETILKLHQRPMIDHLISGLPFASLPKEVTTQIVEAVADATTTKATFTTFQYLHAYQFKNAKEFRAQMEEKFGPLIRVRWVLFNMFPAAVLTWQKKPSLTTLEL
ncbi:class I SAM-dependent methyltransferase [Dongshaea marina]|uniref:class I SAM-dependent methyltransferase n=1 Tax=Dongshaea marina TaxID=2047966 RepID=UPI000D3E5619|nr:rRNA adenine N-6-methyltransferase family protein [Dongshaea marina]